MVPENHATSSVLGQEKGSGRDQQQRMLGAALKKFSCNGYLGTTISSIAAEAGVSYGLVHHYFGSKQQLFIHIVQAGLDYLQEARHNALTCGKTSEDALRRWTAVVTQRLGQTNVFGLYSRLVMQILGAPGMHPQESVQHIRQFTENEIRALHTVLSAIHNSEDQAYTLACAAFNAMFGGQLFGSGDPDRQQLFYQTGCHMLQIDPQPHPGSVPLPSLPWGEFDEDAPC